MGRKFRRSRRYGPDSFWQLHRKSTRSRYQRGWRPVAAPGDRQLSARSSHLVSLPNLGQFSFLQLITRSVPFFSPLWIATCAVVPQCNLAAPKIVEGRHVYVNSSRPCLSGMLLENDSLALVVHVRPFSRSPHAARLFITCRWNTGRPPQRGAEGASGRISGSEPRDRARHTLSPC